MPQDDLTLTVRLHDPLEKQDAEKAAVWAVVKVPREDMKLGVREFVSKYVEPELVKFYHFKKA